MSRRTDSWSGALHDVAGALLDLFRAEVDELGRDLRQTRKRLGRVLILAWIFAFVGFWLLAVVLYSAIEIIGIWLPRWGAALSVAGVLALVLLVFWVLIRSALRRLDNPVTTVQRRFAEHLGWWSETLGVERRPRFDDEADREELPRSDRWSS